MREHAQQIYSALRRLRGPTQTSNTRKVLNIRLLLNLNGEHGVAFIVMRKLIMMTSTILMMPIAYYYLLILQFDYKICQVEIEIFARIEPKSDGRSVHTIWRFVRADDTTERIADRMRGQQQAKTRFYKTSIAY